MAAVNKDPYVYTKGGGKPHTFLGLVQAGATQAIKIGEICTYNETTGYFIPVDAVADHRYPLAIAKEEQKALGRGELTAARYMEFYSCHPDDVFEFAIAASAQVAVGDPYTLTASDSQKLTAAAGAFAVAISVGQENYPQEEDTSLRYQSYARVSFNPAASYWGYRFSQLTKNPRRIISTAVDVTLAENDMYNTIILVTASKTVTLPAVKPGMDIIVMSTGANAIYVDPNASDKIRLAGALLGDGKKLTSNSQAGDAVRVITESADGFIAFKLGGTTWTGEG